MQVQFELLPFRSLLLGEYQLVSLPLHTWMLPFWRFPLHIGAPQVSPAAGSPIRVPPDRSLHAATRSISQLATPFVGAQAQPSFRWLIMPNLLWNPHSFDVQRPMHGVHRDRSSPVNDHYTLRFPACVGKLHHSDLRLAVISSLYCLPVRSTFFTKEVIRPQVPLRPPCYDFSLLA
jgi:hypothetical protein